MPRRNLRADDTDIILGECRKNAPTHQGYPATFSTDWCGSYAKQHGN